MCVFLVSLVETLLRLLMNEIRCVVCYLLHLICCKYGPLRSFAAFDML